MSTTILGFPDLTPEQEKFAHDRAETARALGHVQGMLDMAKMPTGGEALAVLRGLEATFHKYLVTYGDLVPDADAQATLRAIDALLARMLGTTT